jgi:hypothetical protein
MAMVMAVVMETAVAMQTARQRRRPGSLVLET